MSYRLIYTTDIHLNFLHEKKIESYCRNLLEQNPDAVVITGDISEAPSIMNHLGLLQLYTKSQFPIFFVLGNHDFYYGSVAYIRQTMEKFFTYTEEHKNTKAKRLGWLDSSGYIPLTDEVAMVGHNGWWDGGYSNWFTSKLGMNDYIEILELNSRSCPLPQLRYEKINEFAQQGAEHVYNNVTKAFVNHNHVFVATHVPPFAENSVYNGKISDSDWLPHFSSKRMGDVLIRLAEENPSKNITVLCGHSHGHADNQILPNLRCITGEARYKHPKINKVFEL